MTERQILSDALDLVIQDAESARELCEVGEAYKRENIKLHLLQAFAALGFALDMLESKKDGGEP